jgi:tetratricopeptide (TPR) repeat protein
MTLCRASLITLLLLAWTASSAWAQSDDELGTPEEMAAVQALDVDEYARARELAEAVLKKDPNSIPALFALSSALHYGEANLPKALFGIRRARTLLEKHAGIDPKGTVARYWYQLVLTEEAFACGDLDRREEQLAVLERRDEVFGPRPGDRIWALIKLKRWRKAEDAIDEAKAHDLSSQVFRGFNGDCALWFERRMRLESFEACMRLSDQYPLNEVAWSNTAESAMGAFNHAEGERMYLKATELRNNSYGSPWRSLGMIYLLEGRVSETLAALKRAQQQRMAREAYTLQQDQASMDTAVATLMIALGRGEDALRIARRVYETPDRAGGTSATILQGKITGAILFYNALQLRIGELREEKAAQPWTTRLLPSAELEQLELEAWSVRRRAIKLLAGRPDLTEILRPYLTGIVNTEVWLIGCLGEMLGPGVAAESIRRAERAEKHPAAEGYFHAYHAEVALVRGDHDSAATHAGKAMDLLPPAEVMLRARTAAVQGAAADEMGNRKLRDKAWNIALEDFPATFRRLDISLPVAVSHGGDDLGEGLADALLRSPRFHSEKGGLSIKITTGAGIRACLNRRHNALHGCAEVQREEDEEDDDFIVRASSAFHDLVMSPKLDLSQSDVRSLDGSPASGRARKDVDNILDSVSNE